MRDRISVYPVVLVGGIGKRLKPLSTQARPKPFLSITKDRETMFAKTVGRIERISGAANVVVVANKSHKGLVKKYFPEINRKNLILEPLSRNTAPAITLAAFTLAERSRDAIMVVVPADHYIPDEGAYLKALKTGIDFVKKNEAAIVTVGLLPRFPSTGFGYIKIKAISHQLSAISHKLKNVYKVERFVEKPGIKMAKKFLKNGRYLWNTGTFIFKAKTLLGAVNVFSPEIYDRLKDPRAVTAEYRYLPNISIDYAVMEKVSNIYCVKSSYEWEDVGSFENLEKVLKKESRDFILKNGKVVKIL